MPVNCRSRRWCHRPTSAWKVCPAWPLCWWRNRRWRPVAATVIRCPWICTTSTPICIAPPNKCLEGVPGMAFVLVEKQALAASRGNSHSLSLDLHDQYAYLQRTGQWRYTALTHVLAALRSALDQYHAEGGQAARLARYQANGERLRAGLAALGLQPYLPAAVQAPIIYTAHAPAHPV